MGTTKQVREGRRKVAELQQAEYAKLTLEEKLARAGAKEKSKLLRRKQK